MPFTLDLDKLIDRKCRVAPTIDLSRAWLHVTDMQVTCTDPKASGYLAGDTAFLQAMNASPRATAS